ncbi:MAG: GTP pyrophosphokinase family protein [Lachnospiraceae bacterium]|jgi:putative GTP pyrophosphokinase|nr:GTP pyrophosphokinase family protein [Lachnospiraceae bacterium]
MNHNIEPITEENVFVLDFTGLGSLPGDFSEEAQLLQETLGVYAQAIRVMHDKLGALKHELVTSNLRCPIEAVKSRVKTPESIAGKLAGRGFEVSVRSMVRNLDDIAGVRIICPYIDDVYQMVAHLQEMDGVQVLSRKDYIRSPKPNGYRSYHLILEIPVEDNTVKVEVQLRTIAMDYWASVEHELKYKKSIINGAQISEELRICAEELRKTEETMQQIRRKISGMLPA